MDPVPHGRESGSSMNARPRQHHKNGQSNPASGLVSNISPIIYPFASRIPKDLPIDQGRPREYGLFSLCALLDHGMGGLQSFQKPGWAFFFFF